jgi:hypothetical protein
MIISRVKEVKARPKGCPFNIILILSFQSLTLFLVWDFELLLILRAKIT